MKPLTDRDRRALILLAVAAGIILAYRLWPEPGADAVAGVASVPQAERRVQRLRQMERSLASREEVRKRVSDVLAGREKGVIQAETVAQAEAQVLQVVRRVLKAQSPPVELRGSELRRPRRIGADYAEVSVQVSLECGIEQILNLLSDLGSQPEALGTSSLAFDAAHPKQKTVPVRIVVTALVPRKLLPEKAEGQP